MPGRASTAASQLSLRAQVSHINAYADTATNVNTRLNVANLALQGLSDIGTQVKSASTSSTIVLNNNGQTSGQITAQAAFANAVSLLNSQSGDRYLFSGPHHRYARDRRQPTLCSTASATQAGLTQLINERQLADQGTGSDGTRSPLRRRRLTTTVTSVAEDGSAFGLKLAVGAVRR